MRQILRIAILIISVGIPIAFIADVDHVRQSAGITWLSAVGSLVALSLVIAIGDRRARRAAARVLGSEHEVVDQELRAPTAEQRAACSWPAADWDGRGLTSSA
jgi:hypothetical protein